MQVTVTTSGQGNTILTYTSQDFDIMYSNYQSIGDPSFKASAAFMCSQLGFLVPVASISINVNQPAETMTVAMTATNFAQKVDSATWRINGTLGKYAYTSWSQSGTSFSFTAPTKPELPYPQTFIVQLPSNAVNIQFNPNTYMLTYQLSTSTPTPSPQPRTGCLIATALYGSPLQSEVQFLRHFRDDTLVKIAGQTFRDNLNDWYYSFSPQVSEFIRQNQWTRPPIILLGSPTVSFLHFIDSIIQLIMH
jgi:hypothetical protein